MKKAIFIIAMLFATQLFAAEGTLKFGIAPSNPNSRDSLNIFVKFLSEKSGKNIQLIELETDELLAKLASGEVTFADLTPAAVVTATNLYKDKIKYVVTVAARNEKGELVPYYKGVFFVMKDSPHQTLHDLKGKSFAFVSKTSTSGYIYPLATMSGMGIDPDNFFGSIAYVGDHAKIFDGLKSGFLDAGVSNYDALEKAKMNYGNVFRKIGETAEISSGAVMSSALADPTVVKKVEEALLSVKPTDPVVNYPGFLYKGWVKKGGSFYDFIKKLFI